MKMKKTVFSILFLVCGLGLTLGLNYIFTGCPASDHMMMCQITSKVVTALGVVVIVNSGLLMFSRNRGFQNGIVISNAIVCIITFLIPMNLIGGCKNESMRCHTVSFPMIYLVAAIGLVLSVFFLFVNRTGNEELGK